MTKSINIGSVTVGEGMPKICVSLCAKDFASAASEAMSLADCPADLIEWRLDHFEAFDLEEEVLRTLAAIVNNLSSKPLLFTFRSLEEGGEKSISPDQYLKLNLIGIQSGLISALDLELFSEPGIRAQLLAAAHDKQIPVIMSSHDFEKTPAKIELCERMQTAAALGADIVKIAVMPKTSQDVLMLLEATADMKAALDRPIITMAMGGLGTISRISGEIFGSAMTFGALKKPSAPGQLSVSQLRDTLTMLHHGLEG